MATIPLPDGRQIDLGRPLIMGIANITPDSFSDGGRWTDADAAVQHCLDMAEAGADLIDVGGESTRPGSRRVPAEEQIRRAVPVIKKLTPLLAQRHEGVAISIDTTSCRVAEAALGAGATVLNDVSAGRDDQRMFDLAKTSGAPIVLMHMRGTPATMQEAPHYDDVVAQVQAFLMQRAAAAMQRGVEPQRIIIDPGIGFGKTRNHNLTLLANLDHFTPGPHPVLLGTSRKRFMGAVCQRADGTDPAPHELIEATCATTALGVAAGVAMFRVHDVLANRRAADVSWAIVCAKHPIVAE